MGYSKKLYMEKEKELSRYIKSEKIVCPKCINDKYMTEYVKQHGSLGKCCFCGKNKKCIPLNDLLDMVYIYIYDDYSLADDAFMYDSLEGGWQGPTYDCFDLLESDLSFMSTPLLSDIQKCFAVQNQPFCDRFFTDSENEKKYLKLSWNDFVKDLQNTSRFTLLMGDEHEYGDLTPIGLCNTIGLFLQKMDVIKELPISTIIFRARKNGEYRLDAEHLGAPPSDVSPANRMSPPGISFFYGSFDRETCLREASGDSNDLYVLSEWELLRSVRLLDLSKCYRLSQEDIDIFDHVRTWQRHIYPFLHEFITWLCKPVDRSLSSQKREIEYLPTQVFSEYLKNFFKDKNKNGIDGLIYPSSQSQKHDNIVLFYGQECNTKSSSTDNRQILSLKRIFYPKIIYKKILYKND